MTREKYKKEVRNFCTALEAEGIKYVFLSKCDEGCSVKTECTGEDFVEMLSECASFLKPETAGFIGANMVAIGMSLLKVHDEKLFGTVKKNIAKL